MHLCSVGVRFIKMIKSADAQQKEAPKPRSVSLKLGAKPGDPVEAAIAMRFTLRFGAPIVVGEQGKPMSPVFCCRTLTRLMTTPECIVHEFLCFCSLRLKVYAESVIDGIPLGRRPAFCPNCRQEYAFFTKPLRLFYADGDKWLRAPLPSLRFRSLIQLRNRMPSDRP
jgi:hypothetical protein